MAKDTFTDLRALHDLVKEIRTEKRATEGVGKTTFPQESVDDKTHDVSTGSHAAENTAYVKETTPGTAVDEASEAKPGSDRQDELQPNIGTQQSATGEDPSAEDDYKATKDDPGTSHPAKADDGQKYAGWTVERLLEEQTKQANLLLATIAKDGEKSAAPAGTRTSSAPSAKEAAAAGYAAAAAAGARPTAQQSILDTVKEASHMAELTALWLLKRAEEEEGGERREEEGEKKREESHGEPDGDEGGEGGEGAPPSGPPAPAPGGGEELLGQMLGGGAGAGAGAPPPPAPMPGPGGPGGPGGDPGMPPTHDDQMQGLSGAMDDMQLTPELIQQLIALLQAQGGEGMKAASALKGAAEKSRAYRLTGKYTQGVAKSAKVAALREQFKGYLSEIVRRSGYAG